MPHTHPFTFRASLLKRAAIVLTSMAIAFFAGVETAGDVRPITSTNAVGIVAGDFDGNGVVDLADAHRALRIAEGLAMPSLSDLQRDPTQDGRITDADVTYILQHLPTR